MQSTEHYFIPNTDTEFEKKMDLLAHFRFKQHYHIFLVFSFSTDSD